MRSIILIAIAALFFSNVSVAENEDGYTLPAIKNPVLADWAEGYYSKCRADNSAAVCQCSAKFFAEDSNSGNLDHLAAHAYNDVRMYGRYINYKDCVRMRKAENLAAKANNSASVPTNPAAGKPQTAQTSSSAVPTMDKLAAARKAAAQKAEDDFLAAAKDMEVYINTDLQKELDEAVEENSAGSPN